MLDILYDNVISIVVWYTATKDKWDSAPSSTNTVAVATLFESTRYKFFLQCLQDVYITGVLAKKNYNLFLSVDDTDVFHNMNAVCEKPSRCSSQRMACIEVYIVIRGHTGITYMVY